MTDTVTVAVTLPVNGSPLDRAQAIVAAMYTNPDAVGKLALGQLLADLRADTQLGPPRTTYLIGSH